MLLFFDRPSFLVNDMAMNSWGESLSFYDLKFKYEIESNLFSYSTDVRK